MASYLIHYNKNHDKLGRFAIGDGDGDGIRDDHANQNKESVGDKVKKAVAAYDDVKNSYRQRAMAEENYKLAKEKTGLQRDQVENLRNIEQNAVKSRDLDVAAQKQQAKVDAQTARTQAFIDRYRAKTEVTLAKAEQAEARARALAARAEMKAIKNADRLERQAARREREAERRAERQAIQAEKRAARQEERMAARAIRAKEKIYTSQIADRNALVRKYNSRAKRQKIGSIIALSTPILLPVAIGLNAASSANRKKADEIQARYYPSPY